MKRLQNTLMYLFIATAVAFTSCDAEDGEDGMDGTQGEQGIPGENGQDGNANVTGLTIDPFPDWQSGFYLGAPANFVEIDEPLLSTEVVDDALVLVYFQLFGENIWYPMPFSFPLTDGSQVVTYTYEPDLITIYALSSTGALNAGINKVRYFIIPTSDVSGRSALTPDQLLEDLKDKGVDISNYDEVAAYYNLN